MYLNRQNKLLRQRTLISKNSFRLHGWIREIEGEREKFSPSFHNHIIKIFLSTRKTVYSRLLQFVDITLNVFCVWKFTSWGSQSTKYPTATPFPSLYGDIIRPSLPSVSHSRSLCPGRPPQSLPPSVCTSQCCSSSPGDWGWPQSRYELLTPPSATFPTDVQEEKRVNNALYKQESNVSNVTIIMT